MNYKNSVYKSKDVTYYVNREKKTVVAVIKCGIATPPLIFRRMLDKFENSNGNNNLLEVQFDNFHVNKAFVSERFVGIARCHEGDLFDEEFGKKLALARAREKKANAIYENYFKFIDQLDKLNYLAGKKSDELYCHWIDSSTNVNDLLKSITGGREA